MNPASRLAALADHEGLQFEHLVQINDAADLRVEPLSREQLWRGLQLRAQLPGLFIPWLDDAQIQEADDGSLRRELRFGDYRVRDQVRFVSGEAVHYAIDDITHAARFRLTMRIEEPQAGALFVRFRYEALSVDHHRGSPLGGMLKDAYRQADHDTVFRIRQLAASGALDAH